ncbi:MAG: ATP-binding cassette domain-containing protein [Nitrospiraceae bacterium]|nr:ATP-binding cassette domain-containing protein [Nitrospiraceae bacterium]
MLLLENLHVSYGPIEVIHGINLEVKEGEIVSLLGSNGAGKTTTLKTISGVVKPTSGKIIFNGKDISKKDSSYIVSAGITHVPEGRHIFPGLTVRENLLLGAYTRTDKKIGKDIERMFSYFPILEERKSQPAGTLSGGEQQILAIGRGLMAKPKLLLLDEPSLGIAPKIVSEIFSIIKNLKKEGITVLLIEQNARKALDISDRGYVLVTGSILLNGTSGELQNNENVKRLYLGR